MRRDLRFALERILPPGCIEFADEFGEAFLEAPGSSTKHHAWRGGYADHLDEVIGIARVIGKSLNDVRPLPFTVADAVLVLFLHDAEKIFRKGTHFPDTARARAYVAMAREPDVLKRQICLDYGLTLTTEQENALRYVHGELDDYDTVCRVAGPLAAFVHCCDYLSARLWFDEPRASGPIFKETT